MYASSYQWTTTVFLVYKSTFYDQTKNNQSDFKAFLK